MTQGQILTDKPGNAITVRLMGGLGNQLFQYASARALALRLELPLYLDERWYERVGDRSPELRHFSVSAPVAPTAILKRTPSPYDGLARRARRVAGRASSRGGWPEVIEEARGDRLNDVTADHAAGSYLVGYWQDPEIFGPYWGQMESEFEPRSPMSVATERLRINLLERDSVSIHVRRGDFAADPSIAQVHPVQTADYYMAAISLLKKERGPVRFFAFSDDPLWTQTHLVDPAVTVVAEPVRTPFEDLMLMCSCRAHIISNSSFSWWAAWLGSGREGTVIAPAAWYQPEVSHVMDDPVLPHWIRL